jgi:ribosome biogenesis GTPase
VASRIVSAVRARELGRRGVVVGDRVRVVGDVSGRIDALARIVGIAERTSVLTRTADDEENTVEGRFERVVVANADQLVIVSSLADPPPRTGFIDRCLVAAYDAGIEPLLCLTKADLAGPDEVLGYYADLGLAAVLCRPDAPLDDLRARLAGRISVMIGHSGVGKSTLVNRLVPSAARTVGVVSAIGKGRHTSTSVVALPLAPPSPPADPPSPPADPAATPAGPGDPASTVGAGDPADMGYLAGTDDDWIIDTPGIRSFGLAKVSADSLLHGFRDLVEATTTCPHNCDHTGSGADRVGTRDDRGRVSRSCGLDRLVASGGADPRRLASYRRLLASRTGEPDPQFQNYDQSTPRP